MNLFFVPDPDGSHVELNQAESHHCVNVLRHKKGDIIHLVDGRGGTSVATIVNADPKKCFVEVTEHLIPAKPNDFHIHISIAPTKQIERFEWFLEKATEIGVDEISPIHCQHSERTRISHERSQKKLISAMKQALRSFLPVLNEMRPLSVLLSNLNADTDQQRFIAHIDDDNYENLATSYKKGMNSLILIGPEGDFSAKEISEVQNAGFKPISLGKSRLRTETAGIVACQTINLLNE